MLKIIVFLLYLLPGSVQPGALQAEDCNCPQVTNLQKSGESNGSYSISWSGHAAADGYAVWYTRLEDGYTSLEYSTTDISYSFGNLTSGRYLFQVAAVCEGEKSSWIGVEDIVEN